MPCTVKLQSTHRQEREVYVLASEESKTTLHVAPNEPVGKGTFLKTASSAGSKMESYFLSSRVFGSGNSIGLNF
jgi:hypothetical protein